MTAAIVMENVNWDPGELRVVRWQRVADARGSPEDGRYASRIGVSRRESEG